ncbi:hypothetical protein ACFPRL_13125 [Pseudoclavibacter helvolus]
MATPAPPTARMPSPRAPADPTMIQLFFFMAVASCWLPSREFVSVAPSFVSVHETHSAPKMRAASCSATSPQLNPPLN